MADTKVSALTEDISPSTDDLIYTVNDPGGTPVGRKVTLANLNSLLKSTTSTLTNHTIDSANNTLTVDLAEATVTGTTAQFNTALSDGSFATLAGSETLTNKTITTPTLTLADANGAAPTTDGEIKFDRTGENLEVGDGLGTKIFSHDTGTATLQNKTIDSANNTLTLDLGEGTLTGTTAQFNTALSDGSFATLAGTETLTNKTLTTPTITLPDANGAAPATDGEIKYDRTAETLEVGTGGGTKVFSADADLSITESQISDLGAYITASSVDTLTNKTFDLGGTGNSLTGSLAEFNTALQGDSFVSLTGAETLTNKTLTNPVIGQINDANGNESAVFTATLSAVNHPTFTNAATGNAPSIRASGGDTNVDLIADGKGTGNLTDASGNRYLTTADEGSGNGIDADTLDGVQGSGYVQTSVQILPGDGLSDGGALTGNVTLNVDIQGQTEDVAPGSTDWVLVENNLGGTFRKVQLTNLPGGGGINNVVEDTAPQLGGMLDVNGQALGDGTLELLTFSETVSAVNHVEITNAATGNASQVRAAGDDTNIDLIADGKGTGNLTDASGNRYLTTADEGSGNGLDADTLDGNQASAFATAATTITVAGTSNEIDSSAGAQDLSTNRTWTIGLADNATMPGTGGIVLPSGTTAQRSAVEGTLRYNSSTLEIEGYMGAAWTALGSGAGGGDLWSDAVDSDILPTGAAGTYDLGSGAAEFQEGWINQLYVAAGTQSAPSFALNGDTDTGIYSKGANAIGFTVGGGDTLRFIGNGSGSSRWVFDTGSSALTASAVQTQGQGTLVDYVNIVTTVGTAGDVVTLPSGVPGEKCIVMNAAAANALTIYPESGDALDGVTNGSLSLSAGEVVEFIAQDAGGWRTLSNSETERAGGMSSFSAAADSGTPETIADGNTLTIAGGTGITTSVGATDTVTINADAASDTVAGIVELATIAETNTGTATNLAVTPDGLDGWTGSAQITTLGTIATGTWQGTAIGTAYLPAASDTGAGIIELATIAETNTGTATDRAVTPDGLDGWTGSAQVATVGALTSGSIASGFGTINIGTSNAVSCGTVELGHASDTTLARASAGNVSVEGTLLKKVGKETIWVPASAMTARTTSGAASGSAETATNKVMVETFDFDTAADEFVQFSVAFPKSWNAGTVTAQFFWTHPSTATNFGVAWAIQAVAFADSDALDTAFGTAVVRTDTGGTTDDVFVSAESGAVTIAGTPGDNEMVIFQVFRDVSDAADNMAVDAKLLGVKLFYTTDAANDD